MSVSAIALFMIGSFYSCKEEKDPEVTTMEVKVVDLTHAVCGVKVISDGSTEVNEVGLCWGLESQPTIDDSYDESMALAYRAGVFSDTISNLQANRLYYIRAYAGNDDGVVYGQEITFKTVMDTAIAPCSPTINSVNFNGQFQSFYYTGFGTGAAVYGQYAIYGNSSYSDLSIEFSEIPVTGKYVCDGYSFSIASGHCMVRGVFGNYTYIGNPGDTVYVNKLPDGGYSASFCNLYFYSSQVGFGFTSSGNLTKY